MSQIALQIEKAVDLLQNAHSVVALTGAGISTPSGIPDFRSADSGLWENADPMKVATLFGFKQRPRAFYDWVRPLLETTLAADPNPAHYALALLEKHGPLDTIITQNIDLLHTRAGSQNVLEVHGHMRDLHCLTCGYEAPADAYLSAFRKINEMPHCPECDAVLKPAVILFGEQLSTDIMVAAEEAAVRCDVMLIAGSALEVAPVSQLPFLAHKQGARLIIVNHTPTPVDTLAHTVIRADVAHVLPRLARPFKPKEAA